MSASPYGRIQHPALGLVNYRMDTVSDDPDTQVAEVIGMMRRYALEDAASPEIKRDAVAALHQYGNPVDGVFQAVKSRLGFVQDETTAAPLQTAYSLPIVETLVRPRDMSVATARIGDCDDFSMYGASLLYSLGVPVAFVTVAADPGAPDVYSHVYLAAYPNSGDYAGHRVPLDISHGPVPGWEFHPELRLRRTEWPVTPGAGLLPWLALALGAGAAYLYFKPKLKSQGVN